MRTTIELTDEHRARLTELAARRGIRGFSKLIGEAVEKYLDGQVERGEDLRAALAVQGLLDAAEADSLAERCQQIRREWR